MIETSQSWFLQNGSDFRIVGLNNDKTRKIDGSDVKYRVYFELSGTPSQAWGMLFEEEWKALNATQPALWQAASIDRRFIIMCCPLEEVVSMHLPFLRKAVEGTNKKYEQYVQELRAERKDRQDVWKRERTAVNTLEKSLQF